MGKLTLTGLIFMIITWGSIWGVTIFCFLKIMKTRSQNNEIIGGGEAKNTDRGL